MDILFLDRLYHNRLVLLVPLTSYLTIGAATDNLESDKLIHSAQKEVYGPETIRAVSYTHLTLPTIYSV